MVYIPGNHVHLYGASSTGRNMREYLLNQQRLDFCPVPNFLLDGVGAELSLHEFSSPGCFSLGTAKIHWEWVPRGDESPVVGYRIEEAGKVLTYLTNVEYQGRPEQCKAAVSLAQSADLLLHDGQLLPGEPIHPGYAGHSSYLEATALAEAAHCRQLVLCHHDPRRTDEQLASLEKSLQATTKLPACMARELAVFEL
jgi:ribonuclease BN (tRNA processing enzyme)